MINYQWISLIIGLGTAGTIMYLIRRDQLQPRYAFWWIWVAGAIALFGIMPRLIDKIGSILGISYPPILLMILGIAAILIKMLKMDIESTRKEAKIRRLTQRLAILEGEIDHLRTRNAADK
jgi:hypothetical protein